MSDPLNIEIGHKKVLWVKLNLKPICSNPGFKCEFDWLDVYPMLICLWACEYDALCIAMITDAL